MQEWREKSPYTTSLALPPGPSSPGAHTGRSSAQHPYPLRTMAFSPLRSCHAESRKPPPSAQTAYELAGQSTGRYRICRESGRRKDLDGESCPLSKGLALRTWPAQLDVSQCSCRICQGVYRIRVVCRFAPGRGNSPPLISLPSAQLLSAQDTISTPKIFMVQPAPFSVAPDRVTSQGRIGSKYHRHGHDRDAQRAHRAIHPCAPTAGPVTQGPEEAALSQ
jgi:hypothetical protein